MRHREPEHTGVESDRSVQLRDLQVNMTDNGLWIYRFRWSRLRRVTQAWTLGDRLAANAIL